MQAPDSCPQPDSHAFDARQACIHQSIGLARIDVGNEARGRGVDGLQRLSGCEVVGAIVEPFEQSRSRLVDDDSRTIAVLGELEGRWFQVDPRAAQHCD
jgi:hypothetical protein